LRFFSFKNTRVLCSKIKNRQRNNPQLRIIFIIKRKKVFFAADYFEVSGVRFFRNTTIATMLIISAIMRIIMPINCKDTPAVPGSVEDDNAHASELVFVRISVETML
jgi:hypothetical protein